MNDDWSRFPPEVLAELQALPERMTAWRMANPQAVHEQERRVSDRIMQAANEELQRRALAERCARDAQHYAAEYLAATSRRRPPARARRVPWPAVLPGAPLAVRVPILMFAFLITLGVAMLALCWLGWRFFAARMNAAAARLP